MMKQSVNLDQLVKEWVQMNHPNRECLWVDLEHTQNGTKKQIQRHKPVRAQQTKHRVLSERLVDEKEPKKTTWEEGGAAEEKFTRASEKTVAKEHALSITNEVSGGVTLGISYVVDIGVSFDISHSKTKSETEREEVKKSESREFTLKANTLYHFIEIVEESSHEEKLELTIVLSGDVAFALKNKIGKEVKFVSIAEILRDLDAAQKLPQGFLQGIENNHVTVIQTALHTYKQSMTKVTHEKISGPEENNEDNVKKMSAPAVNPAGMVAARPGFGTTVPTGSILKIGPTDAIGLEVVGSQFDEKTHEHIGVGVEGNVKKDVIAAPGEGMKIEAGAHVEIGPTNAVGMRFISGSPQTAPSAQPQPVQPQPQPASSAQALSQQGVFSGSWKEAAKLINEVDKLLRDIDSNKEVYYKNRSIKNFCLLLKELIDEHNNNQQPFTQEEKKEVNEMLTEVRTQKAEIDNAHKPAPQ